MSVRSSRNKQHSSAYTGCVTDTAGEEGGGRAGRSGAKGNTENGAWCSRKTVFRDQEELKIKKAKKELVTWPSPRDVVYPGVCTASLLSIDCFTADHEFNGYFLPRRKTLSPLRFLRMDCVRKMTRLSVSS